MSDIQNNEKRIPFLYKTGSDRANQSRQPGTINRIYAALQSDFNGRVESASQAITRRRAEFQRLQDEARRSGFEIVAPFIEGLANERTEFSVGAEHRREKNLR